jgi:uncharacterized protein
MNDEPFLSATRDWVRRAVIGLDLCPFAQAVDVQGTLRIVVSAATTPEALLEDLGAEIDYLEAADPAVAETTLLVHPHVFPDFLDANDFLEVADATLEHLGLDGVFQVAQFHPQFRFEGSADDDIENYTNRSPYPILHLLREESVERAVARHPDTAEIYKRNIATLRRIGHTGWRELFDGAAAGPPPGPGE